MKDRWIVRAKRLAMLAMMVVPLRFCMAQNNEKTMDSLKAICRGAKADTARIDASLGLAYIYIWENADSGLYFSAMADSLSRKIKDEKRSILSLIRSSSNLLAKGIDSAGLQALTQARERAERMKDDALISTVLANLGSSYANFDQYEMAVPLIKQSLAMDLRGRDTAAIFVNLDNLGMVYLAMGELDSALSYANRAYEICIKRTWTVDMMGGLLRTLGRIQHKMGDRDIAMAYYRRSLPYSVGYRDWSDLHGASLFMGELFEEMGQRDSAQHYFRLSHAYAENDSRNKSERLAACQALSRIFRGVNSDSTVKYLELVVALKDSLNSDDREKAINNSIYMERKRDEAAAAALVKAEEMRRRNIRLLFITVFIITLFLLLMLLAGMKAHPKLVRFSGVLALLLAFEFITLLVHPLISVWTHEDPVWMLLILVGLAAILVPLHHRVESWMVHRLSRPHVQMRKDQDVPPSGSSSD